jgi:hypothetical protein
MVDTSTQGSTGGGTGSGDGGTGSTGGNGSVGGNGTGSGTGSSAPAWHGYETPEDVAYVTNKGWQGPQDVIKSYRGAERMIGKNPDQLLELPRADDPAGFRALAAKLGMPETADKYDLGLPKDAQLNEPYAKWAKDTFHKVGLTAAQAKQLVAENEAWNQAQSKQASDDYERNTAADKQALLREWGGGHERMLNAAKTAANALGFTAEMVSALEQSMGYAGVMKFFNQLGMKMSEDGFEGGTHGGGSFSGTMTPAEAKAQWEAMKLDTVQQKALLDSSHPGHKAAKEKQSKLFAVMYPNP